MSSVEETIEQLEHACKFDVDRAKLNNLMHKASIQLVEVNQQRDELAAHLDKLQEDAYQKRAYLATEFGLNGSDCKKIAAWLHSQLPVKVNLAERDAKVAKKTLERFAAEYAPYGLRGNYTSFDVSQHAEAQSIKYSEEILSKGRKL